MLLEKGQTDAAQALPGPVDLHSFDLAKDGNFWRPLNLATSVLADSSEVLTGEDILLDQIWALEVVCAIFCETSKAFKNIRRNGGRFRPSELAEWIWRQHSVPEQEQDRFLDVMRQCGLCFMLRSGDKDIEADYIAPDLLPTRDDPSIALELLLKWDDRCDAEDTVTLETAPHELMRTLIATIGEKAGLAGVYWREGFYFYDRQTGSRALVEQVSPGEIHVRTQRGQAQKLLKQLVQFIGGRQGALAAPAGEQSIEAREKELQKSAAHIEPTYERSAKPEYFVSYAWGDDTLEGRQREAIVDALCKRAETSKGVNIIRDKTAMKYGARISIFMNRLAEGNRIFIVLSDKYLKSRYCMRELFEVWRNCREDPEEFIARTRVFMLTSAEIGDASERTQYVVYWRKKLEEKEALVKEYGPLALSDDENAEYRFMKRFVDEIPNILSLVLDTKSPCTFDDFVTYGFDDPPEEDRTD